jgi:hypothetical protein
MGGNRKLANKIAWLKQPLADTPPIMLALLGAVAGDTGGEVWLFMLK